MLKISDLTLDDLSKIANADKDAPDRLFMYGTQLSMTLKMATQCQVIEFWGWNHTERHESLRCRLDSFKKKAGSSMVSGSLIGLMDAILQNLARMAR